MILLTKLDEPSLLFAKNGRIIEFGTEEERRMSLGKTKDKTENLLIQYYLLYLIKFVESFERGEVVHVKTENLVTYLTENRIVKLEE